MRYEIILRNKQGEAEWFSETFLPNIIVPDRILPLLMADFADDYGLCNDCDMDTRCHPLNEEGYKYCTILFHDSIRPNWKLKNVI